MRKIGPDEGKITPTGIDREIRAIADQIESLTYTACKVRREAAGAEADALLAAIKELERASNALASASAALQFGVAPGLQVTASNRAPSFYFPAGTLK